jgi:HAMP domain-containing protein
MEGHRLAQTVAYGDLSNENPAPITAAHEPKTLILKTAVPAEAGQAPTAATGGKRTR